MKILVVDAFDSFVYTIHQYLLAVGTETVVVRSNRLDRDLIDQIAPDAVVLGPGPGHPLASGHVELVHYLCDQVPILGICLGHQAIGAAFGASVIRARHLVHGKTSLIDHQGHGVLTGMPERFTATRYHSLVVDESTLPAEIEVTARSEDDGYVMAMRHREYPIESVQFHPESVCTTEGMRLFQNFVELAVASRPAAARAAAPLLTERRAS